MTPEEKETLRRIQEAEEIGAVKLDLSWFILNNRLPPELERLVSLQSLDLSYCEQLSELSSLTSLTSLQKLTLAGCRQLSDLSPLAGLTSLQSLNLKGCKQLSDLSSLASLTSLQSLDLSWCKQLSDLSPLAGLTSLQSLDLSYCEQLSELSSLTSLTSLQKLTLAGCGQLSDLSPLTGLTSLQSLTLAGCRQLSDLSSLAGLTSLQWLSLGGCLSFRRFAPLESLLPTLKQLYLFECKFEDLPPEVRGEDYKENVLDKVRAHYYALRKIFVSYAWGNISPNATQEDQQRQEVVERLCRKLEQERWNLFRDKGTLDYGDQISTFMKTLGQARLVIVVLSEKYLRSPYCMTELYSVYQNVRQERQEFLNRIIPLVLNDANIGTWRGRATYAEHWETEFKAMGQHFIHLGEEDLKLYKAMRRWHNEVGDMLAYVNDVLSPHGFDEIVKDDFAALRQMLQRHR